MSITKTANKPADGVSPITKYTGADAKAVMAELSAIGYPELDFSKFLDRRGLDFEIGKYEAIAPSGAKHENTEVKVFPKGMDPDSPDTPYILADVPFWNVQAAIEDGVYVKNSGYDENGKTVYIPSKAEEYWKESRDADTILAMTKGLANEYREREENQRRADRAASYEKNCLEARKRDVVAASFANRAYDIISRSYDSSIEVIDRSDNEKTLYNILASAFKDDIFSEMESDEPGSMYAESGDIAWESFEIVDDIFESDHSGEREDMEKAAHALAETIPEGKSIIALRDRYHNYGAYTRGYYMIADTPDVAEKEINGKKCTVARFNGFNAEIISANKDRDGFDTKPFGKDNIVEMLRQDSYGDSLKVESVDGVENDKSVSNPGLSLIAIKSETEDRERYGILKAGMDQNAVMAFLQTLPRDDFERAFGRMTVSNGALHAETEGDIKNLIASGNTANLYEADLDKGETTVRWFDSAGATMSEAKYETARFEPPFEKYPDKSDAIGKGKAKEVDGAAESYDEDYGG